MSEGDERLQGWFAGRLPDGWFEGAPRVTVDREEILIVGTLPDVEAGEDATDAVRAAARAGRIKQFREETRTRRMQIAELRVLAPGRRQGRLRWRVGGFAGALLTAILGQEQRNRPPPG